MSKTKGLTDGRLKTLRVIAAVQVTYCYRLGTWRGLYFVGLPRNASSAAHWLWDEGFIEDTHVRVPGQNGSPDSYVMGLTDKGREALP